MKRIWLKKFKNFTLADKYDQRYYRKMGSIGRLETIQQLREQHKKLNKKKYEGRERLRRVVTIVQ